MNKFYVALLGALALVAVPALSGCETDTATDLEGDGTADIDTAVVVDDEAAGMDTDPDVALDDDVDGDSVEANLEEAGDAIGNAAQETGEAIEGAARSAGDVIDENVDLGENAENQ